MEKRPSIRGGILALDKDLAATKRADTLAGQTFARALDAGASTAAQEDYGRQRMRGRRSS